MATQWQEQRLQDALHSVANDHDVERAVKALLAEAWMEGFDLGRQNPGTFVNPYAEPTMDPKFGGEPSACGKLLHPSWAHDCAVTEANIKRYGTEV